MKLLKMKPIKVITRLSLSVVLLLGACAESGKKETAASTVETPKTTIQTAVLTNNVKIVKQHIAAGTDLNAKDQMTGSTPLMTAVVFGKTAVVKALLEAKVDMSVKNNDGATALHNAAFFCHKEITQLLIDAKADKTIKNNYGVTARESVLAPFASMEPVYKMIQQQLAPMGLKMDLVEIEKNRPVIAEMLK